MPRVGVGTSPNYAIKSSAYPRDIHKQLCRAKTMGTMYRLIQITTTRADFTTSSWQNQTIKRRMSSPDQDLRYFFFYNASSSLISIFSSEDGLPTSCLSTTSGQNPPGSITVTEVTIWRNYARFHDSRVHRGGDVGRELFSLQSECVANSTSPVSISWTSKHHFDGITLQRR